MGSIDELRQLSGFDGPLDDIHRDKIDGITIPSQRGKGTLRRVDEIFDCWFVAHSLPPLPFPVLWNSHKYLLGSNLEPCPMHLNTTPSRIKTILIVFSQQTSSQKAWTRLAVSRLFLEYPCPRPVSVGFEPSSRRACLGGGRVFEPIYICLAKSVLTCSPF